MSSLSPDQVAQDSRGIDEPVLVPSTERRERLSAWLQFPRRIVLLLIAFALALLLLRALRGPLLATRATAILDQDVDWSVSWLEQRPWAEIVWSRLSSTLVLLGAALLVGLLMAGVGALVAVQVHKLEGRSEPQGSVLKGLGRLWVFGTAAMPAFGTAFLLFFLFSVKFREWSLPSLPMGGTHTITPDDRYKYDLLDRLQHLILPSLALALLPAALTGQAVARELTLSRNEGRHRLWLLGLFRGLGTLLGQTGGWLSAAVVVDVVFSWPGIGRLALDALYGLDLPVVLGTLGAYALLILAGRLGAELFRWLERLIRASPLSPQPEPRRWRRTARTVWVVAASALLLIPLGIVVAGATVDPGEVLQIDVTAGQTPPSSSHPWGTDNLGRDVRARVLRGGLITLGTVGLLSAAVLLPGALGGAVSGSLASRRTLWSESLADLLLLPADVLLFVPALPAAIVISVLLEGSQAAKGPAGPPVPSWLWVSPIGALVLLPRAVRACQALWTAAPRRKGARVLGLAGTGALLLGVACAGLWLVTSLEWLGMGAPAPLPTLGGVVRESVLVFRGFVGAVAALWGSSLSLYAAADALTGFLSGKEVLSRLNE